MGVIIEGGWTDSENLQADRIRHLKVVVEKIFMDADLDPRSLVDLAGRDEWHVYVGVNGRWKVFKSLHGDS
jgi:hypothetical protein